MIRKLIAWALDNPLVVILLAIFLAVVGVFSFLNVNVEAYPDPAPAIVEVIALFPGASSQEVERQVTIPLEVTFAGMPGLKKINSKSLFGLSDLKMTWNYGSEYTYQTARQEVINRMSTISQPLPPNVTPAISPESPTGEIFRYVLKVPKDRSGRDIYTLNDIKAMQDWVLEREFRTVPRIVDVTSFGGTVRRYEVQPDPDRLRRYGITLGQLQATLANSNATVGGDYLNQGQVAMTVRSVGLFGGGLDPVNKVLGLKSPAAAASILRAEELRRIREIRGLVITSVNNQPIRVEDVVEGGRLAPDQLPGEQGVVVSNQTRLGRIGYYSADFERPSGSTLSLADVGHDQDDKVTCIVLLRKGEETLPALKDVEAKVKQMNDPDTGRMLPGTEIEPYYDRTDLLAHHHRDRDREPLPRHCAGRHDPVHVREQHQDRDHRRHQHPPGASVRLHDAVRARQVGKLAVDRGGRFRHHRRFVRGRRREHLPQPGLRQPPRTAHQGADPDLRARRSTTRCSIP